MFIRGFAKIVMEKEEQTLKLALLKLLFILKGLQGKRDDRENDDVRARNVLTLHIAL